MLLSALQGTMRNFAYALSQIAEQKGEDGAKVEEVEQATQEIKEEN